MLRCQPRDPVLNCEAFVRVFVCSCVLHRLCRHDPDTGPVDTSLLHGVPVLRGEADCPADQDGFPGTDRQAEGDEGVETEPGRARGTDRSKAMVWIQASKQGRGEESATTRKRGGQAQGHVQVLQRVEAVRGLFCLLAGYRVEEGGPGGLLYTWRMWRMVTMRCTSSLGDNWHGGNDQARGQQQVAEGYATVFPVCGAVLSYRVVCAFYCGVVWCGAVNACDRERPARIPFLLLDHIEPQENTLA